MSVPGVFKNRPSRSFVKSESESPAELSPAAAIFCGAKPEGLTRATFALLLPPLRALPLSLSLHVATCISFTSSLSYYSSSSAAAAAAAAVAAARFAASGLLPRASAGFEAPDPALLDTAVRAIRRASACAPVLELRRPRPARNERKVEREEREEGGVRYEYKVKCALLLLWDLGEGGSARRAHSRFIPAVLRAAAPSASATATAAASAALALAASFACADLASGFVPPEVEAVTAAALLLPPPLLPAIAAFSVASSTKFCDFRRARSAEVCVCCAERSERPSENGG